jgi:phosphoribosylformylglycinamidine cyclo-ligase
MPGFYPIDEYDLAGFSVGIVEETRMIRKEYIKEGNVIISLPSSGVHSNGFSLVRKVFNINEDSIAQRFPEIDNKTLGEVLLTPTKIYVKPVLKLLEKVRVNGISHITGGGFYENIPRCLPDGYTADINMNDVKVLPIFKLIQKAGDISTHDMFNTFNMGVGMIVVVNKEDADEALAILSENGISPYILGKITKDTRKVILHE